MSNRTTIILAVVAVISSLCIYATFAQERPQAPEPEDGAIVIGPPPIRLQQELPGRYEMTTLDKHGWIVVLDTHSGQCWSHIGGKWQDFGSPVNQE